MVDALQLQLQPTLFALPLTEETKLLSIDELISFVRINCNCDFIGSRNENLPILNCENMCLTQDEVFAIVGLNLENPVKTPKNIPDFVELYEISNETEKLQISSSFDYVSAIQNLNNLIKVELENLLILAENIKTVNVKSLGINQLMEMNTLEKVRSMYLRMAEFADKADEILFLLNDAKRSADIYDDENEKENINDFVHFIIDNYTPIYQDIQLIFNENKDYFDSIENNRFVIDSIKFDPRLNWYWSERTFFDDVISRMKF